MDDLISRQAAIDAIEHRLAEPAYQHTGEDWYIGMNCAESELYDLPSAQPEIIRCRDCKHWGIHKRLNIPWCREMHIDRGAEDFCSFAERRTDEME